MEKLTADDALTLISNLAKRCRENGESDMRNILNAVRGIKSMMAEGKSGSEILAAWGPDDDEEDE